MLSCSSWGWAKISLFGRRNEKEPDYLDFAYMSFGIGMAAQVADIDITSREMRHWVTFHALLSFMFNTVIVALTITAIAQLI